MNKLERYPQIVNSQDLLKFFGIIVITLDHVSTYFSNTPIFNVLGNFGAPLFFFLAGQHNPKRIFWGYLLSGLFITLLTYLTQGYWFGNILLSFFLIKLLLYLFPNLFSKAYSFIFCILFCLIHPFNAFYFGSTFFEFGGFGLSYAISAYLARTHRKIGIATCLFTLTAHYIWMHIFARSGYQLPFDLATKSFTLNTTLDYWCVGLFYAVYLIMFVVMLLYKLKTYPSIGGMLSKVILVVSRFSFEIYALQMVAFRIIAALLGTYGSFII